jgi:large repetitive protein
MPLILPAVDGGTTPSVASGSNGPVSVHTRVLRSAILLSLFLVTAACGEDPTAPLVPISIGTAQLREAVEGLAYGHQLEASGGSGGYSWLLAAGSLPGGLSLTPAGAISGTPSAPGTWVFRVRATDLSGRSATADLTLVVVQALAVHVGPLPEGVAGEEYAVQLQAVGGRGTRSWSVTGGEAAAWLSISPTGRLSGVPQMAGSAMVTVAVADESGQQATRQLPVVVLAPVAVADMTLPVATEGRIYAAQLVAAGGDGVYSWTLDGGVLPPGMGLGSVGDLVGTPEAAGVFTFTARVADGGGRLATRALSLTVVRAPTIRTPSLPPGEPGKPYAQQLSATGGTGAYTWTVTEGALPGGLTLSAEGFLSGTPSERGSTTFTVQVADGASAIHTRALTLVVAEITMLIGGVPLSGIGGEAGSLGYYAIEVPPGATRLTVTVSGGEGDVDLYVRRGALPEPYVYDCRPLRQGNEEVCTFMPPFLTAGPWYVLLRGYTAYGGVTLRVDVEG